MRLDSWEEDRQLEAIAQAASLNKNPGLAVARLRRSRQGCDWLIERWIGLEQALEGDGDWTEEQTAHALDLLGVPPLFRNCSSRLPRDASPERKRAIVAETIDELEKIRVDRLERLDTFDRDQALTGDVFDNSPEAERLRRLDRDNTRIYVKIIDEFAARRPATPHEPAVAHEVPREPRLSPVSQPAAVKPSPSPIASNGSISAAVEASEVISKPSSPTVSLAAPNPTVPSNPRETHRARQERRRREEKKRR